MFGTYLLCSSLKKQISALCLPSIILTHWLIGKVLFSCSHSAVPWRNTGNAFTEPLAPWLFFHDSPFTDPLHSDGIEDAQVLQGWWEFGGGQDLPWQVQGRHKISFNHKDLFGIELFNYLIWSPKPNHWWTWLFQTALDRKYWIWSVRSCTGK